MDFLWSPLAIGHWHKLHFLPVKREQVGEYKNTRAVFNNAINDMNGCVKKKLYEPFVLSDPAGALAQFNFGSISVQFQ